MGIARHLLEYLSISNIMFYDSRNKIYELINIHVVGIVQHCIIKELIKI
jgi:hypothetical protein